LNEYVVVDVETGDVLAGEPEAPLASVSTGWAWMDSAGTWHLQRADDPSGLSYRLLQVLGGPQLDPHWYENTVENLDTSEGV
jgi:hypothetical protein